MNVQGKGFKGASSAAKSSKLALPNPELEAKGLDAALKSERKSKSDRQVEAQVLSKDAEERHKQAINEFAGTDGFSTQRFVRSFLCWWSARADQGLCERLGIAARVLLVLSTYANQEAKCWPSQSALKGVLGCSERTVRAGLRKLEALGLIVSAREGAKGRLRGKTNLYRINVYVMLELVRNSGERFEDLER